MENFVGAPLGIEPTSPAFQAGVLTTTSQHPGTKCIKFAISNHPCIQLVNTNGVKNPSRRTTARNTRCQESAKKNNSKNYQSSRIRWEESQQEIPGVKNPPRRITARTTRRQESPEKNYSKNTRHKESAEKNYNKKYQASRICQEE